MRLTTQRLKKIIREEMKKMNEGFGDLVPELEDIRAHAESLGMKVGTIIYGEILPLHSNPEEDTFDGDADLYVRYEDDGSYVCQEYGYMGGKKTTCPTKEDVIEWLKEH